MKLAQHFAASGIALSLFIVNLKAVAPVGSVNADADVPVGQSPAELVFEDEQDSNQINLAGPWRAWDTATGNWAGVRETLLDHGIILFGGFATEVWGNTTGGIGPGAVSTSLFDFGIEIDLEKLVGWEGATVYNSWFAPMGRDVSSEYVGNLFTVSNAAALNSLYLYEFWFQQTFLSEAISIRLGQLAADTEFASSDYGSLFINATFGWPSFLSENIPSGGPTFPKGTLGVRLALNPTDWFTFQTAIFQGDPFDDTINRHGFRWRLDSEIGAFGISEGQVRWNSSEKATGLPGQIKIGSWYHTASFASADPESSNIYRGNYGFYGVIDQLLYREPSQASGPSATLSANGQPIVTKDIVASEKSDQGLGAFGRISVNPQDRNFIAFYFDTGLTYKGLIPSRDGDTIGLAFAYGQVTRGAAEGLLADGSRGVGAEMVLETTYQCQVTPWLTVQPNIQYIINPGATQDYPNALVVGFRASVTF